MRFPHSFLDEIRVRTRISEVIGRSVALRASGRGEFTGLCPFHKEKTPSFTVSDEKNFYHCFGCGAHGDVIRYLVDNKGLSFTEAVTQLAGAAGLALPQLTEEESRRQERAKDAYDVLEAAAAWYQEQLKSDGGREAREYLAKRALNEVTQQEFRVGFSPDRPDALKQALLEQGFAEEMLLEAGLLSKRDNGTSYDRFRGRVMFPIADGKGRIIAFGGRILGTNENGPKYLNSPETSLFKKSYVLYGWDKARDAAYVKKNIAVVEGYMDVIAMHAAGIKNCVAPLGTALTEQHVQQLWRTTPEPVLCMDGDNAGKLSMYRAACNFIALLKPGFSLKFAMLPEKQDPDDVIKQQGVVKMREILAQALPLSEVIWNAERQQKSLDTPEQKADFQQRLLKLVGTIQDPVVRDYYKKDFTNRLWEMGIASHKVRRQPQRHADVQKTATGSYMPERLRYETLLLKLLLNHPAILQEPGAEEDLMHLTFTRAEHSELREAMIEIAGEDEALDADKITHLLEKRGLKHQIDDINACKFTQSFAKTRAPLEIARSEWRYIVACYNFTVTEEEFELANKRYQQELSEDAEKHQQALKEQREVLKFAIAQEKRNLEALLEDHVVENVTQG